MRFNKPLFIVAFSFALANCASLPLVSKEGADEKKAPVKKLDQTAKPDDSVAKEKKTAPRQPNKLASIKTNKIKKKKRNLPQVIDIAKGKLVFIRSSVVASAVEAALYEVSQGVPCFISAIKNNTQVHYDLDPGRHVFMLSSQDSVDYLEVHVEPHLSYYAVVKPSMGAWKPSFSLQPIKARLNNETSANDEVYFFDDEQAETLLSAMTPIIEIPYPSTASGKPEQELMALHQENWQNWANQSALEKQDDTLRVSDGR